MASRLDTVKRLFGSTFSISRWYTPGHDGIDLAAKAGTPVYALASGRVSYARNAGGDSDAGRHWAKNGGNVVNVDIDGRYSTQYAHLQSIVAKEGATVKRGDLIGYVGESGTASGPHLHFGLWDHYTNKMIEPTAFLTKTAVNPVDAPTGDPVYASALEWARSQGIADGTPITAAQWDAFVTAYVAKSGQKPGGEVETSLRGAIAKQWIGKTWGDIGAYQTVFPEKADPLATIGDILGKLADPANWVRILALFGGAIVFGVGTYGVLTSTGNTSAPRRL